ncbi:MAG TPA: class I SAM-dependent methyltransferase [Acidobacteriota bacterium]|nr:class I SAM-dependent methyltransferase [Acidobacteriota bacterium]
MKRVAAVCRLAAAMGIFLLIAGSYAWSDPQGDFEPYVGQPGKDVVWVPTPQALVDKMLEMANVTPDDYLVDLGSGDGRTVITAAKRGIRAMGVEYNPDMVRLSIKNAEEAGVSGKAKFIEGDIFKTDFSDATVITMFLLPDLNLKLRPAILDFPPGTRIVSNSFTMSEWVADRVETLDNCDAWCTAYLWIVPARVQGSWETSDGRLTLKQEFQMISGTLVSNGKNISVNGKLNGDQISFSAAGVEYTGRVKGPAISGTAKSGMNSRPWTAVRK